MATILQLKVAKWRLFEKVNLEGCQMEAIVQSIYKSHTIVMFREKIQFEVIHISIKMDVLR